MVEEQALNKLSEAKMTLNTPGGILTLIMSSPPIKSPFTYNCGYVGQFEYFFNPSLTCQDGGKIL